MVTLIIHTNTYIWDAPPSFLWSTHTVLSNGIESYLSGVKRLRRQTTHRHLVQRIRMGEAIPPLSHMPSWVSSYKLVFILTLRDSKRTQNSVWLLNYAAGHCLIQLTIITWSSNRELLKRPTTTGPICPISIWRRKDPVFLTLGFRTSKK
jgi:hypothetical protein